MCLHLTISSVAGLCFYDNDKNAIIGYEFNGKIDNTGGLSLEAIEIPENAMYIRT